MNTADDIEVSDCGWCGCCGRAYYDPDGSYLWCGNCAGHVLGSGYPWDATYMAQTGRHCPYQVKAYR